MKTKDRRGGGLRPDPADVVADAWGDEVADAVRDGGLDSRTFLRVYRLFVRRRVLTAEEVATRVDIPAREAGRYVRLLTEFEDVYPSVAPTDDDGGRSKLFYCYAPQMLAALCRRRRISLARYLKLGAVLSRFSAMAERYYVHRLRNDGSGGTKISEIKRRYVEKLQPIVAPDSPLEEWRHPVTTHPAWRYLRTAQDLVALKMDIPRPFLDAIDLEENGLAIGTEHHFLVPTEVRYGPASGGRVECQARGCYKRVTPARAAAHAAAHRRRSVAAAARSKNKAVIECEACGANRVVNKQDAFQVRRCIPCQVVYRRARAVSRRAAEMQLERELLSRRDTGRVEVTTMAQAPSEKRKVSKAEKPAKEKMTTIKCAGFTNDAGKTVHVEDCSKTREIHVQDAFQVKRSTQCQKAYRRQATKARRAARTKAAPKARKVPKARKAPRPASKPATATGASGGASANDEDEEDEEDEDEEDEDE